MIFAQSIVGIDIHDHLIQVVELKKKNKFIELVAYNQVEVPEGLIQEGEIQDASALSALIQRALDEAKPKAIKNKQVAILLPSQNIFAHIFKFPSNFKKKDLERALPFEAERIFPFSLEEVYWDFISTHIKEGDQNREQLVLMASTPKKISDSYEALFKSIGIHPTVFGVQIEALAYALKEQIPSNGKHLLIDFGSYSNNFILIENGLFTDQLSQPIGGDNLLHKLEERLQKSAIECLEDWANKTLPEDLTQEVQAFIHGTYEQAKRFLYAEDPRGETENIFLTGNQIYLPYFLEEAAQVFPDKKLKIGDPKAHLQVDNKRFQEEARQKKAPYSIIFTNAIGVAKRGLRGSKKGINLWPHSLKKSFQEKKLNSYLSLINIGMTSILLLMSGFFFFLHQKTNYEQNRLAIEKSGVEKVLYGTRYQEIQSALQAFNSEVKILSEIDRRLFSSNLVLENIFALIPNEITITGFQINSETLSMSITGTAPNREILLALQDDLEAHPYVDRVDSPLSNFDRKSNISFGLELLLAFSQLPKYGDIE